MIKKRFLSMLVLLVAVVTGAVAQSYKVTVKDGTTDAAHWTIAPSEATTTGVASGTSVTATYSGHLKVKSVKAVKMDPVPVTSITLNKTTTTIIRGKTETLSVASVLPANATDQTVTWSSSTANATVNASTGVVTAVAAGEATITATANDGSGVYATCTVTVLVPAADNAHPLASSTVGDIIGSNGQAYAVVYKGNLPSGVYARAMVAYKSGSNGLAISLVDVGDSWSSAFYWSSAEGAVANWASSNAVSGCTWCLPNEGQWRNMFKGTGNEYSYSGMNSKLIAAGGSALQADSNFNNYWTSTESSDTSKAQMVALYSGQAVYSGDLKTHSNRVRACIAF